MASMYLDRKPAVGDYIERTKEFYTTMSEGSIWKVNRVNRYNECIAVESSNGFWEASNFKVINPEHPSHPEYKEQTMSTPQDIKVGSHWERLANYTVPGSEAGEIVTVEEITGNFVHFNKNRTLSIEEFLERFKPRPDLDATASTTYEFNEGDLICYNQEARDVLGSAKGTLPNAVIGNVTKVIDRTELGTTPLLEYKDIRGNIDTIDSGWVTKYIATPTLHTAECKIPFCTVAFTDKVETTRTKFEYDRYTLAINPDFFNSLSTVDRLAMIKHELLHILVSYNVPKKSWTQEQLEKIQKFCNNTIDEWSTQWDTQQPSTHLENFTIPWYEDVVNTAKPKPVAQQEPIQLTTKETFMSKIKDTALTTVGQNKQALVIASKMEAGRIINKQVLKQLKPHLPFFLQGYASSPFAPFVAANLVAMIANHTQNSKLLKVSDLMLLGAADSGVASFNLNDIIEDILSKIKLPAGALDDSDE